MLRLSSPRTLVLVIASLAIALTGALVPGPARAAEPDPAAPRVEGTALKDARDRTLVLRGINIVDKSGWHGRLAAPMLDRGYVRQLAAMGFNHVRFGFTWDSVQHNRSRYDDAYIDQVISQLDLLHRHHMTAVVDVHQDAWSASLGFDGAPAWADPQCRKSLDADIDKLTGQFFLEYLSPAVTTAFANFYNDGYGALNVHCTGRILTDFARMWSHLADRLAGHPAVIGYDILNEPWVTSVPGVFETTLLTPFYKKVAAGIRRYDTTTPIFFEPVAVYQNTIPYAGTAPDAQSVFAPHLYTEKEGGLPFSTNGVTDSVAMTKSLGDGSHLGTPVWIGEWGHTEDASYITRIYDLLDQNAASAAFWADLQFPGDRLATELEEPHVRPYVEAYPGTASWSYDAVQKKFEVTVTTSAPNTEVQLVVPARLELRVVSNSGGPLVFPGGGETCTGPANGPCRATWTLPNVGAATLKLEPPTT